MNNKLEDFIHKNKDAFDEHEPSGALWNRLEKKLEEKQKPGARLVQANWLKWAAAAVLLIVAGVGIFRFSNINTGTEVSITTPQADTPIQKLFPALTDSVGLARITDSAVNNDMMAHQPDPRDLKQFKLPAEDFADNTPEKNNELFHYSQLIETQQKQIEGFKTESPELYHRFSNDLGALEGSYKALKEKRDSGYNREKVLEAMIQNLKIQSDILNRQLKIIKRYNHKQSDNEKSFNDI